MNNEMIERASTAIGKVLDSPNETGLSDAEINELAARAAIDAAFSGELSTGRIAVLGNDIGVVGAVVVEVDGVPIARLAPMTAVRQMYSTGRSNTALTFERFHVRWAGDAVGVVSEGDPNAS